MNKPTQCDRILIALRASPGGISNSYLAHDMNILNYKGRLDDLRKKGYDIRAEKVRGSLWKYRLIECQQELFSS